MTRGEAIRNFVVGFTFLGSLAVLGAATLKLRRLPFLDASTQLSVRFPKLDQLKPGDVVTVLGHRIGQVDAVNYDSVTDPTAPILVTCSLDQEVRLGPDAAVSIQSAGALGGRYLDIDPGTFDEAFRPPPVLYGQASGDLFFQLESLVEKNEGKISEILDGLQDVINDIRRGEGLVTRLLQDKEMSDDAREIVDNVRQMTEAINRGDGILGALIHDQPTREKAVSFIDNIDEVSQTLRGEEGVIGYLLNNPEAKDEMQAAISDIREITRMVREGEGVAGKLLRDRELADRLQEAVNDIQEIVHKANSGHGTLGQIINNRKAWEELVRILVQARETIEDLREQAPISTFVNALFAVF